MRPVHAALLASVLASTLILSLRQGFADDAPPAAREAPPAVVSVAPAVRAEFRPYHWAPGSVVSRNDARVAADVAGRVLRSAAVGEHVRAGQPLAALDDAALRLAERESGSVIARVQAQLELAQAQERRFATLAEQRSVARAQYEQQRADRDVLVQELARARAQRDSIRHQRSRMLVRAPFDGVVAERLAQPGEYLQPGDPVARLVDTGAREVRTHAPVALARHLAPGASVRLRDGDEEREARVSALVPVGDEASRQVELRIAVDADVLPVGSALSVGLPSAPPRSVVAVPRDALVLRREGDFVVRASAANRAERLPVLAGDEIDGMIEVTGGVAPGDRLVVRGAERIEPGQALSIQAPADTVALR
ncbi:efflux RND transporter periplasmic adaptor subunit [Luteimonas viscosa]|uniref:Efflux RND transporter periplasmic adaptor subunit n=1 Tax=Luteimonas viscosa TaxID=1132694 RepID=A0A5D4XK75_9GAMM|nr:efflux RND transporter periplasmic adaptor subunit [Luteimonas viscosa]TYT25097.1 efflux RND transporter periplasmic adaptor subunit [Luteimonas viscosa]